MIRALRYLAPNLITAIGLVLGLLSLIACYEGRYIDAGWLLTVAVLTDRLDGVVARLVRGTSELGVHLDSLVDFLTFGICPAALVYFSLSQQDVLPFAEGSGRVWLMVGCLAWVLGATFRLARYNISTEESVGHRRIFFGVPTTLAAGLVVCYFLSLAKYSPSTYSWFNKAVGGIHLFGSFETPLSLWKMFPFVMILGGFLMASTLRMPKLGLARNRLATLFIFGNVAAGSVCAILRVLPEYMMIPPALWVVTFLAWGSISKEARSMKPPPIFPPVDHPPGAEPIRPEDDIVPEGSDHPLDADESGWVADQSADLRV